MVNRKPAYLSLVDFAGALLNKPALLQRAARMPSASPAIKGAARLAGKGGSELIAASIPGSLLTGGLTTLATGNPLAGVAVGVTDLGLSYGGARAVGALSPRLAGKYRGYIPEEALEKYAGRKTIPQDVLLKTYEPSVAQQAAMIAGSVAAPLVLEPLFMQAQQDQNMDQMVTQQQQLGQQEVLNQMYMPYTADGTLYQLQGLPQRAVIPGLF